MSDTFLTAADAPPVERELAFDMVRRAARGVPVLIVACGLLWGLDGAASSAYAVAIVLLNFLLAAALLSWTARISLALMMVAALGGYLLRLGLILAAVLLVRDAAWVQLWALGLSLVITHLGLLLWETRYVSASLAFPALKPGRAKN